MGRTHTDTERERERERGREREREKERGREREREIYNRLYRHTNPARLIQQYKNYTRCCRTGDIEASQASPPPCWGQ
ncbi:hypothetical protein FHG87_006157 [Trinorchestia longiramus]|nr:hypothetical protein FHG87_006157 [Trinorchestia longiramus]